MNPISNNANTFDLDPSTIPVPNTVDEEVVSSEERLLSMFKDIPDSVWQEMFSKAG